MVRQSDGYLKLALTLVCLLCATNVHARRLMELEGIELHGTVRIVEYSSATCHVLESNNTEEEYERLKVNEGQSLDLWQLDFTVYNGSGKALDHLIARYGIESPWPPCTNWSYKAGATTATSWSNESGHIQRTGQPYSVAPDETLTEEIFILVFHEDEPRFANWSVDYNFAESSHATPGAQPPPALTAELPPVPGLRLRPTSAPGIPVPAKRRGVHAGWSWKTSRGVTYGTVISNQMRPSPGLPVAPMAWPKEMAP